MDIQQIDQILNLIEKTSFIVVEIEEDGLRVRVRKGASPTRVAPQPQNALQENDKRFVRRSPLVGTFYRAPSPSAPHFVEVGDLIKKGQVLCIVEALKLMNEVESEVEGKVISIYVENAQPVEYGEPLFEIEKISTEQEVKHVH